MAERRPYLPSPDDLAALNIFLSYRSAEWREAQRVRDSLLSAGLKLTLFEPDALGPLTDEQLRARLGEATDGCDAICIVGQHAKFASPWIHFEFMEAGVLLGRVIIIASTTRALAPRAGRAWAVPGLAAKTVIKESIIEMTEDGGWQSSLLDAICNDPDEWWFDEINASYDPAWPKNLKRSISLLKLARSAALKDPRYAGRTVVEVIPFELHETGMDSLEEVPLWYVMARGRLGLIPRIASKEIVCDISGYYVPDRTDLVPSGLLDTLVLLRGDEDP